MQHAMMTSLMNNRLFWAPINPNPLRVLDLGTGTGIWAIDFAEIVSHFVAQTILLRLMMTHSSKAQK